MKWWENMDEGMKLVLAWSGTMGVGMLLLGLLGSALKADEPSSAPTHDLHVHKAGSGWIVVLDDGFDKGGVCFVPSSAGWDGQIK